MNDSAGTAPSDHPTRDLARWALGFDLDDLDAGGAAFAGDLLLDFMGVAMAGAAETESARVALDQAGAWGGAASATLLRPGAPRVAAEHAAFAHGVAGHGIELDDVHNPSSTHPGVVTIPAALAVAEEFGRSGRELIEAIVAGYEIVLRVGSAAGPARVYGRGFHPTAVCGPFGAAMATARLMRLTLDRTLDALGLAWSFAGGTMAFQTEGSWVKRMQVGNAARGGVAAARLAAAGASGPHRVFEADGFFRSYAGGFDPEKLLGGLGREVRLTEVSLKPYACCRYSQTPVDALLELRRAHGLEGAAIERIEIAIVSAGLALVAHPAQLKRAPRTEVEAQFSLPYAAAVAAVTGRAGREEFREPWLSDPGVLDLAGRVRVGSEDAVDRLFPDRWPARVRVVTRGGDVHEAFNEDCLGDPGKPLGAERTRAKFDALTAGFTNKAERDALAEAVAGVASLADAGELMRRASAAMGASA